MASRAKLTLVTKQEETVLEEKKADNSPEIKQGKVTTKPSKSYTLVKGLLLAGLSITSLIILKRKLF